jgi:hypothetical protein
MFLTSTLDVGSWTLDVRIFFHRALGSIHTDTGTTNPDAKYFY